LGLEIWAWTFLTKEIFKMNRRDQELLDRQTHVAPRHDGVMMLAIVAVFLAGMAIGGFLSAYTDEPGPTQQIASNDVPPAIALPQGQISQQ
jgi:hypothetical protein